MISLSFRSSEELRARPIIKEFYNSCKAVFSADCSHHHDIECHDTIVQYYYALAVFSHKDCINCKAQ